MWYLTQSGPVRSLVRAQTETRYTGLVPPRDIYHMCYQAQNTSPSWASISSTIRKRTRMYLAPMFVVKIKQSKHAKHTELYTAINLRTKQKKTGFPLLILFSLLLVFLDELIVSNDFLHKPYADTQDHLPSSLHLPSEQLRQADEWTSPLTSDSVLQNELTTSHQNRYFSFLFFLDKRCPNAQTGILGVIFHSCSPPHVQLVIDSCQIH